MEGSPSDSGGDGTGEAELAEAGRAELHRTLESVLVIDMRFAWNGIGNSLTRWLAVLRLGTAAGRATFLWFSDRGWQPGEARVSQGEFLGSILRYFHYF